MSDHPFRPVAVNMLVPGYQWTAPRADPNRPDSFARQQFKAAMLARVGTFRRRPPEVRRQDLGDACDHIQPCDVAFCPGFRGFAEPVRRRPQHRGPGRYQLEPWEQFR